MELWELRKPKSDNQASGSEVPAPPASPDLTPSLAGDFRLAFLLWTSISLYTKWGHTFHLSELESMKNDSSVCLAFPFCVPQTYLSFPNHISWGAWKMLPVSGYLGTCFILVPWSKQKKCHLFIIWSDKGRKRPSQLTIMDKTKVIYRIFDFERQLETYSETYNYLCPSGKHPKPSQPGLCPSLGFGHSVERGPGLCK